MEANAVAIESALSGLEGLPASVSEWQIETGVDATDDPAVWVWVVLQDENVDFPTRSQLKEIVREVVNEEILKQTNDKLLVYIRFLNASEVSQNSS